MLSPEIQHAADLMAHGSQSIASVRGTGPMDENRFAKALAALSDLSSKHSIPIALVGGLGAIRYGYPAITEDIDVVIAQGDLDRFIAAAGTNGFRVACRSESGWHTVTLDDVEINVFPEGRRARDDAPTTIPGPQDLGVSQGLDYAEAAGWVELKMSSNRRKDQVHVIEVLKRLDPETIKAIRESLIDVHELYVQRFDDLAAEADTERNQEDKRK